MGKDAAGRKGGEAPKTAARADGAPAAPGKDGAPEAVDPKLSKSEATKAKIISLLQSEPKITIAKYQQQFDRPLETWRTIGPIAIDEAYLDSIKPADKAVFGKFDDKKGVFEGMLSD